MLTYKKHRVALAAALALASSNRTAMVSVSDPTAARKVPSVVGFSAMAKYTFSCDSPHSTRSIGVRAASQAHRLLQS
jgi:hypothetical protein